MARRPQRLPTWRAEGRLASIRAARGRLFIDYRDAGKRQRVYTRLSDTAQNRGELARVASRVDKALQSNRDVEEVLRSAGLVEVPCLNEIGQGAPLVVAVPAAQALTTFAEFSEVWFKEFKVGWRKTYVVTVRGILDQHLLKRFGPLRLNEIARAQILDFRAQLASQRGRKLGTQLSPARINTVMLILRQVLQEAADRYQFTMPMGRLRPLKVPKSDVDPFTLDEVQRIVGAVRKDYRNYMVARFFTGMRSGVIHGLKWKYIDFERRLILVRETIVGGEEGYTKTDSSQRDIAMSGVVFDALKAQREATARFEFVFCNRCGEPLDTNNFTKRVWYPLLRHLGLTLRRPYQTRHTAATLWLAAGESPEWIARQLGHASTDMLFRVYSRFVPNLTRRDGSAFDRLLGGAFAHPAARSGNTDGDPDSEPSAVFGADAGGDCTKQGGGNAPA